MFNLRSLYVIIQNDVVPCQRNRHDNHTTANCSLLVLISNIGLTLIDGRDSNRTTSTFFFTVKDFLGNQYSFF